MFWELSQQNTVAILLFERLFTFFQRSAEEFASLNPEPTPCLSGSGEKPKLLSMLVFSSR